MEVVSRVIKVQLPNYLKSLPIPSTLGGFLKLSGNEWVQLVPFVVTTSVVVYLVVSALLPSKKKPDQDWVNKKHQKDKDKVADVIEIEDLGEKTVFCRCWKSKKFPHCDGSHNQHNQETGDNVGPVVLKRGNPAS